MSVWRSGDNWTRSMASSFPLVAPPLAAQPGATVGQPLGAGGKGSMNGKMKLLLIPSTGNTSDDCHSAMRSLHSSSRFKAFPTTMHGLAPEKLTFHGRTNQDLPADLAFQGPTVEYLAEKLDPQLGTDSEGVEKLDFPGRTDQSHPADSTFQGRTDKLLPVESGFRVGMERFPDEYRSFGGDR